MAKKLSNRDEADLRFALSRIPAGTQVYPVVREGNWANCYGGVGRFKERRLVNGTVLDCSFPDTPAVRKLIAEYGLAVVES